MCNYRHNILGMLSLLLPSSAIAQPICTITKFDEDSGMAQWHITQMLQDGDGMMWFATWNGLARYDGQDFFHFKSKPGDGCAMPTDRIRTIRLAADGHIACRTDYGWYLFNRLTGVFSQPPTLEKAPDKVASLDEVTAKRLPEQEPPTDDRFPRGVSLPNKQLSFTDRFGTQWQIDEKGTLYYLAEGKVVYPTNEPLNEILFQMSDRQGNLWLLTSQAVYRLVFSRTPFTTLPQDHPAQIGCFFLDYQQRYWVTSKEDTAVRLFSRDNQLLGYLTPDGRLSSSYASFGARIYCMTQMRNGTYWMGSKPDGLYRLREVNGRFTVEHFSKKAGFPLPHDDVYCLREDARGRLWIATMDGGLCCITNPNDDSPSKIYRFIDSKNYPKMIKNRVRYIHLTRDQLLLAATTEGLLIADVTGSDLSKVSFRLHQKEADRSTSMSSNATMDILEMPGQRFFVSTESGGVNEILSKNLLADHLDFKHYNTQSGLNTDVTMALSDIGKDRIMVTGSNQLMTIDLTTGATAFYDMHFFGRPCRFAEAHPLHLPDGRWLVGLHDGAFYLTDSVMSMHPYVPPLVLTRISIADHDRYFHTVKSLTLNPDERNLTVHFAALDYTAPAGINYAFKMDDGEWNYIGHNRMVSFVDLDPGTYHLFIRSTNGDGAWVDNVLDVEITVEPTFFEAWYGKLFLLLLLLGVLGGIAYTYLYIKRLHQQRKEALDAYLALIGDTANQHHQDERTEQTVTSATVSLGKSEDTASRLSPEDEAFMKRVMNYVEQHISDSDANIGDMADATATSKSGLNRKMKSIVGLTPADFLREARIKRACSLLTTTSESVSEVAWHCGFTDPKYFSKCFKASMGLSPSDYREGI